MFDKYKLDTDKDIPGGEMTVIIFSNATVNLRRTMKDITANRMP